MRNRRQFVRTMVVLPMLIGLFMSSGIITVSETPYVDAIGSDDAVPQLNPTNLEPIEKLDTVLSQTQQTGYIDPILVEQSGYYSSSNISGRTDTGYNAYTNMTINNASNWVASEARLNLWNLNREYAENGTFDEGVSGNTTYPAEPAAYPYGWDLDQYDSSGGLQTLKTYYDESAGYVTVETQGEEDTTPSLTYWHYHNTWNLWNQTIINQPNSNNMTLSFKYNYVSGIINSIYDVGGNVLLTLWIENETYNQGYSLVDLMYDTPARNTWYDFVYYNVTDIPSEFTMSIGLFILSDDYDSFELNPGADYDDDGAIDGDNARVFKVEIDDVSLVSITPPTPEEVDLQFHAGTFSTDISGSSGIGTSIIQHQFWDESYLTVGISANVSVSFNYEVKLTSHYYSNSSKTTHPTDKGVTYSVGVGQSSDLSTFTYIGSDLTSTYENFSVFIYIPVDWENVTIFDPFTNDVTSSCIVGAGLIEIPTILLDRLGWWKIDFHSPNYAKDATTQVYDEVQTEWTNSSTFKSGNLTRSQIELGTSQTTPNINNPVNVSWIQPDSTVWSEENYTSGIDGFVNTTQRTLSGTNTTAGQWHFEYFWTNGSEIAYGRVSFDVYHLASVSAFYDPIEINTGQTITNWIYLQDSDTNDYLMDDSVTIVANWSNSVVSFTANPSKNRWEGTFDTSLVRAGEFIIVVNASRPYFENVSCTFTVISTYTTQLSFPSIGGGSEEVELNQAYVLDIQYLLTNGTGIEGAQILFSYTGPDSGLVNGTPNDLGSGDYAISILGILSGEYTISVNASKAYHQSVVSSFTFTVNEISTTFSSLNGSAGLVGFGLDYRLVLNYTNSTGGALSGATVKVQEVNPSSGLTQGSVFDETNGLYSITFTPTVSDTYTIVMKANITNHVTQYITFTILVVDVGTSLTPHVTSATIALDQDFTLQLSYEDVNSDPIPGATITIDNPPSGLSFDINPLGGGLYNITLDPSVTGTTSFQISFIASKDNYQNSTVVFNLFVQLIPTELTIKQGEANETIFINEEYQVTLTYNRTDLTQVIPSATISVSFSPAAGVTYALQEMSGSYRLTFTPSKTGIWQITVTANRTYYRSASIQLELEVSPISTSLECLNGTADVMQYGTSYDLVVRYLNSTLEGILGATISVPDITPSTGLGIDSIEELEDGNYNITLLPSQVGTYSLLIRASLLYHVTQYVSFTIIVTEIQTTLTAGSASASTLINQSYVLQLSYEDESAAGIAGATITLLNPQSGISHTVEDIGGGVYNITLTPTVTEATSFQLSFKASLTNYENSSVTFSLLVQLVNTNLIVHSGSTSGSVPVFSEYTFILSYIRLDLSKNISGADISISTSPATGLISNIQEIENLYHVTLSGTSVGHWQITVTANRTSFVQSSIVLELDVAFIETTLVSLNGTADSIGFGLGYNFVLDYSNSTGTGLVGATIQVVEVSPVSGLTIGGVTDHLDGHYSIIFTPTVGSSFTINLRANLTNHETKYITFTLMVTDVATVLIPGSVGETISVDQNYTLQLTFEDEASNPITGATITLLSPPAGLSHLIQEVGGGVYNVTLIPSVTEATSFQLSLRASLTNYQSASTAFSLFVQKIPTAISILQGSTSAEIVVINSYSVIIAYLRTDSNQNITSADITITSSPADGLNSQVQNVGDAYQLTFTATRIGIWQITIAANKTNFVTSLVQVELETAPIETSFSCLNGTAGLVEIDVAYNIVLDYENSTNYGLLGATVGVSEITPSSGLSVSVTSDLGIGLYSIEFTPTAPQTYTIVMKANLTNHVTQYITFSLTVLPVETVLIPHISGATISIDKNFTLELLYQDEGSNPIEGATIEIVDLPEGLTYSVTETGSGYYNVTLVPEVFERKSFQISFRAIQTFYQSSTTAFSLLVQEVPTELRIVDGLATATIQYSERYEIWVTFVRTDTQENITGATIAASITPLAEVTYSIENLDNVYHIVFSTNTTGNWQISLRANKTSYETSLKSLELTVNPIDTTLNQITLVESLVFHRVYNFSFTYAMGNGTHILDAEPIGSGSGNDWISIETDESGNYIVTLIPEDIGTFEVDLEFSLMGFVSRTTTLSFTVVPVTINIIDVTGLNGLEGQLSTLSLRIVETESLQPVTGASVTYQLIVNGVPGSTASLEETESGRYASTFIMPSSDSEIRLRVYVDKEYHQMDEDLGYMETAVVPSVSELTTLTRTMYTWSPLIILGVIAGAGYQVRRTLRKRERRQNLEALAVKRRFDDVKNMVGVVVLHKDSGIPVYSRMLRAGFDDSLISAFITAISQFRSEFDVTEKEWQVTPISDIIMAVKTQNLICAFITMGTPTVTQEERMIQFAKSVGFVFDSNFEEAPILTIDDKTENRFDELFDELLDINLHQMHKIVDVKGLPKGPKCLNQTINEFSSLDGFQLDEMADRMAACGIEEARAYKIILDAIERDQLIPVEGEGAIDDDRVVDITESLVTINAEDAEEPEGTLDEEISEEDDLISDVDSLLKKENLEESDDTDDSPDHLEL